jgi:hypothetical protein
LADRSGRIVGYSVGRKPGKIRIGYDLNQIIKGKGVSIEGGTKFFSKKMCLSEILTWSLQLRP